MVTLAGAAFALAAVFVPPLGIIAAILVAGGALWQDRDARAIEFRVSEGDWTPAAGDFEYRVGVEKLHGRSGVSLYLPTADGGRESVDSDVRHEPDGSIVVAVGRPVALIIRVK